MRPKPQSEGSQAGIAPLRPVHILLPAVGADVGRLRPVLILVRNALEPDAVLAYVTRPKTRGVISSQKASPPQPAFSFLVGTAPEDALCKRNCKRPLLG